MRFVYNTLFILIGFAGLFVLVRIGNDYLETLASLQDFRWGVAGFAAPAADAAETSLTLEVQNGSRVNLGIKDLEIYLWLNGATVGKTYGRFDTRTVSAHSTAHIPLTIQIDAAQIREAPAAQGGAPAWSVTGSYKVTAPFVPSDIVYNLRLDIGP